MNFFDRITKAIKDGAAGTPKEAVVDMTEMPQKSIRSIGRNTEKVYLDYASTTPVDPGVVRAMKPFVETDFYNPSSIYADGVRMKQAIADARKRIASLMNVQADEIIFTGSGTESNNLALFGVINAYKGKGAPHIVTSTIEHPSILEACKALEKIGVKVTYVAPGADGVVDAHKIKAAITSKTVLVSLMYVNNEIGTIQPVGAVGRVVREVRGEKAYPYFHVDASQAGNYLSIHAGQLGADLVTLDATKVYGPRGVGLLCVRKSVELEPMLYGGGQENGMRAGTENTAGIVGFATALELAQSIREQEGERLFTLREFLISELKERFLGVIIHGDQGLRVPNIVNVCFPGLDSEFAVIKLDHVGIMVSSASACASNAEENYSATVAALPQIGEQCKRSSLRFSMGRGTTRDDIELLIGALEKIIGQ